MNQNSERGRAKEDEEHAQKARDVEARETLRTGDLDWLIPPQ
jgi:hypothetical protein